MSHGCRWFCAVFSHRQNRTHNFRKSISENLVKLIAHLLGSRFNFVIWNFKLIQIQKVPIQPLSIWRCPRITMLTFIIGNNGLRFSIYQKNLTRLQTGFLYDMLRSQVQYTGFRRQDQTIIIGNIIPGRPQSITIQRRSDKVAIRKQNGRRPIPGFHHSCIVMIEIGFFLIHIRVVLPWFRNRHHHSQRQIHAIHIKELQCIVQHGRIRASVLYNRENLLNILFQCRA